MSQSMSISRRRVSNSIRRRMSFMSISSIVSDDDDRDDNMNKKEVRFATKGKLHVYNSRTSDPKETWYDYSDYAQFREDRAFDASRIRGRHPDDLNKEEECFWGLENLIVGDLRERVIRTRNNINYDLAAAQNRQWEERRLNPNMMRSASTKHSEWSSNVARKKALFYRMPKMCFIKSLFPRSATSTAACCLCVE